jgi:hypothetical protein
MALVLKDRVKETTTSTGTGSVVLAGAVTGFQSFFSALADGDTTYYTIEDGTDWETGLGTWTESTSTLARTTVYDSSNSGNAVDWGAGEKNVFITLPAARTATIKVYPTIDDLPMTGNSAGDQAYVSGNNRLYLFNGTGWYNIALINQTPTVTGNEAAYILATDGTPTVITLTGTDPEGLPLVWTHVATGLDSEATITSVDNVFTITPSTNSADEGAFSVTFRASDGVNIGTASSSFTLQFLSANWRYVSLSLGTNSTNALANSTFIDRSTNALTITASGTATQTAFHPYLENWSVHFDGDGDYLTVPDNSSFDFDADFTIDAWIYWAVAAAQTYTCVIGGNGSSTDGWQIYLQSSNGQLLWFYDGFPAGQTGGQVELNNWTHIAATRQGSNLRTFLNGAMVYENTSYTTNTLFQQTSGLGTRIGYDHSAPDNGYFNGQISDIRVVKGTALYTSAFTPPTEKLTAVSGTSLLTCQSNRFIDNSTNAHTITVSGNPKISAYNPFGQESEYAVGENMGSYYSSTNNGVYIETTNPDTSSNIWECQGWIYLDTSFADFGETAIFSTLQSVPTGMVWRLFGEQIGNGWNKQMNIYGRRAMPNLQSATLPMHPFSWMHLLASCDGSNIRVFFNGSLVITGGASNWNGGANLRIGNVYYTNAGAKGYHSDFKFQIGGSVTTSDFTPPTAPVGNSNAYWYSPMDNAGIFDKTGNNTLTLFGNTVTSTTQTKYADTAMYFDGTGDYITTTIPRGLGSGDFTIEGWVYHTSLVDSISWVSSTRGATGFNVGTDASGDVVWYDQAGSAGRKIEVTGQISTNTWYHFAFIRSSGVIKAYLNGTQVGSNYSSTQNYSAEAFGIGDTIGFIGEEMYGYIENLQIIRGVAKYTANFTPPAGQQGRAYQAES